MHEILTIEVGQAGIQLGNSFWRQYCAEHDIGNDGEQKQREYNKDNIFHAFFEETDRGRFVSRNLAVDLEPNVIDDIKNSPFAAIFHPEFLLNGKEDAGNNYARGYYSIESKIIHKINDQLRKLVDNCDNVMRFLISHSVGGGTGSGLGSLILEQLNINYKKKPTLGFEIYPSSNFSTCIVEPYNALLATHKLLDHTDASLFLDNEAIYRICQKQLHIQKPNFENLNRLISKVISSITTPVRFRSEVSLSLHDYITNLVAFPRLHFMITGMSPIISKSDIATVPIYDTQKIADECFKPQNWFVKFTDFNPIQDKYMAISLSYRGNVTVKESNEAIFWLKSNNKISLIEWCPTGLKIELHESSTAILESDDIGAMNKSGVMVGNNTGMSRIFTKRITQKYDLMYSQRAFIHWYLREGMEREEFSEARQDLELLKEDYLEVMTAQLTDEYGSDNEFNEYETIIDEIIEDDNDY